MKIAFHKNSFLEKNVQVLIIVTTISILLCNMQVGAIDRSAKNIIHNWRLDNCFSGAKLSKNIAK